MWGLNVEAIARPGYLAGIATLDSEVSLDSLPVRGQIPRWLGGTLVRNGPGMFEAGDIPLRHWFDGLAMLSRFSFDGGRVSYANRFLRSKAYDAALRGDISFSEFATDPPRSLLKRAATMLKPVYTDNCSFGVARVGDELVAMTETPARIPFDPRTLESGEASFLAPGQHVVAHPHRDPATGESIGLATQFGRRTRYRIYAQSERASYRVLAELGACEPSYMHSFAMTERHFVLTACPFVVNPLQLGFSSRPFIENFRWRPEEGTKFHVFERDGGELVGSFETDAFFAFHHVNAFERGSELVVDLVAYEGPDVIGALYLEELRSSPPSEAVHGRLDRYRIDLSSGAVRGEVLSDGMLELPQIDYGRHNGRPYRYVYGCSVDTDTGEGPADFLDQVVKIDVRNGETKVWQEPGSYPGEPVFVPAPGARGEDDGVLLTVVLDARGTGSYLLVLDAAGLGELARARLPHHIPFGFHGQYFS